MTEPQKNPWASAPRKKRDNQFPQKREAVLKAAAALFRERGFDRASLNDLADVLQITKPTIYYYVQSKEQLLLDILRIAQDEIFASLRAAEASSASGYEKLRRIMIDYALVMISDHGACMSRIPTRAFELPARAEVAERVEEADRMIYRILEEGRKDGTLSFSDRTVALHTLFGSLNWTAYWTKSDGRLSPQQLAELQVDMLLNGVCGPARVASHPVGEVDAGPQAPAKTKTASRIKRRA